MQHCERTGGFCQRGCSHHQHYHHLASDPEFDFVCRHSSMLQLGCRPRNLGLISVVVLGLSNVFLTFLLLQPENCTGPRLLGSSSALTSRLKPGPVSPPVPQCQPRLPPASSSASSPGPGFQETSMLEEPSALNLDVRLGRWDSRRLYRSFDAVLAGTRYVELSEGSRVCLATQSSLEKLHSLVQVVHQWSGPVSVGLFVAGDEEFEAAQKYLEYMRRCYKPIRERVIFSVAVPGNRPPRQQPRYYPLPDFLDCRKPEGTLNRILQGVSAEQTSWRVRNVYPQNHMRNLARKNCQSEYVFLTDVDIVPSSNLSLVLEEFLREDKCDKCAYVIPTYELEARVRFPQNKTELIRLARKGLARPFHQKVFIHNQFATNFTRWMLDVAQPTTTLPSAKGGHKAQPQQQQQQPENKVEPVTRAPAATGKAYVSHDVTNFEFLYEPFYVARDVAPPHDERFMGYGYTRNTQVYEMYVAGYKFKVLSPTFTVHWGLQTRKSRPSWRERQNTVNRKHFETFKKEVFARYMRDPLKMVKNPR